LKRKHDVLKETFVRRKS